MFQPLVDKFQKWNRQRKYKENDYFKIVPKEFDRGLINIELLRGPFKGIIYSYGSINIDEDLGPKGAKASFDIEIVNQDQDLILNEKFCQLAGQILLTILDRAIYQSAEKFYQENLDEETREDYIEEFVPQRTVSSEDSTIPKKRISPRKKRKDSI